MIKVETYKQLKKQYGNVASWAIWALQGEKPKSNTGDMSVFDDEKLMEKLNTKYVFVGLNASEVENKNIVPWSCFHSTSPLQNDYKLRFALYKTRYWGSYITDVIKGYQKTASTEVIKYMKKNPKELKRHIETFKKEIDLLEEKPILIAMGNETYKILKQLRNDGYEVLKIPHYAHRISKENYRARVLDALAGM